MDRAGISLNLTSGVSRFLTDAEFGAFDSPLFLCASMVVMEVVYWSTVFNGWIFLVREHTTRKIPDGCREIAADELPYYEAQMKGTA